jgi:hypothetical protein
MVTVSCEHGGGQEPKSSYQLRDYSFLSNLLISELVCPLQQHKPGRSGAARSALLVRFRDLTAGCEGTAAPN